MNKSKIVGFAVGPIGSAILGFAALPIMAWFFTAEDIGRISMLQLVCSFSVILFSLGLDQAFVREYHETVEKPALLKNVITPGLLFLLIASLSFILYDPSLLSMLLFSIESSAISLLVILCVTTAFVSRFLSLILRMQEKGFAFSMSQLLPKALFLLIIGTYVFTKTIFNFEKLIIAHALSIIAVMLIYSWNTKGEWLLAIGLSVDKNKLFNMLKYGLPLIVGGVASWAMMATDKILLRSLSSFEELGIYSIAASIAMAAGIFSGIFTTIWAPTVFKWAAEGVNPEKIDQISEHVLAAVFFVFIFTGLFSWVLPYFLPDTYAKVQYLVTACMVAPLLYALSETTSIGISITRRTSFAMLASIVAAAINAIGNYWLIPKFGAAGASASTAFAFWIFLVFRTELSRIAWRKVPRFKLYVSTLACLIISIAIAISGEKYTTISIITWTTLGVLGTVIFKKSIIMLANGLSFNRLKTS